jgi:predicted dienelactone hydrolase
VFDCARSAHQGRRIADPAFTFLFGADDLKDVAVPVQLWSSRYGGVGVTLENVASIDRKLQLKSEFHLVSDAVHWAFLAPCAAEFAQANPRICVDTPGFDRVAFHQEFNAAVLAFFRQHLPQLVDGVTAPARTNAAQYSSRWPEQVRP